jgi:hypothetical protein
VNQTGAWPLGGVALQRPALAEEGTLAPDPHRLARAHRAGLRPTSPWLWPAAACLGLALALHMGGAARVEALQGAWAAGVAAGDASGVGAALAGELTRLLAGAAALALVVAALTGTLGRVDRRTRLQVRLRPSAARGLLALALPAVAVVLALGVAAGAARAVDASPAGLQALWLAWLRYLLLGTGGMMLVAGVIDRALARRRLWRALHRTVAEARAERGDA